MFINLTDKLWREGGGVVRIYQIWDGKGAIRGARTPKCLKRGCREEVGGGGGCRERVKIKKRGWDITRQTYA